jgi:hypothetical protein
VRTAAPDVADEPQTAPAASGEDEAGRAGRRLAAEENMGQLSLEKTRAEFEKRFIPASEEHN